MKKYKKNNITIKELDDGTIRYFDGNGNCIYIKFPDGSELHRKYDENNNCIYSKWPDGNKYFYIKDKKATKAEWINHYINDNFDYRYIFDIIETLKEHKVDIHIQNIQKHLHSIEIDDLETKYEEVLKYWEVLR